VPDLERLMHGVVAGVEGVVADYLAVVDPTTFEPPVDFARTVLVAGAVHLGKTRLIDNILCFNPERSEGSMEQPA
jgi:pantoate--beta-alanine ligase